jgi:hypothetical protein
MAEGEGARSPHQWQHVLSCHLCAGALAHFRRAAAAVVVDLDSRDLFIPLPGFPVTYVLAQAASDAAIDGVERGLVDFVMPAPMPPGAMMEALDAEKRVTVVVPCLGPYEHTPPRIELLLQGGEVRRWDTLEQEEYDVRASAGDPGSRRSMMCWVAYFEPVEPSQMLAIIAPA